MIPRLQPSMITKTKKKLVCVEPVSNKAKNRFANLMDRLHSCNVEQEDDTTMFLTSINGLYHFWLHKTNDEHWRIVK